MADYKGNPMGKNPLHEALQQIAAMDSSKTTSQIESHLITTARLALQSSQGEMRKTLKKILGWNESRFAINKNMERIFAIASKALKSKKADYETETEEIRERSKTPEARRSHKFEPAEWTFKNGHPRCKICGDEERTGGMCSGRTASLLKKAAIPTYLHKTNVPVSKEYDAVKFVYGDFVNYQIEEMSWKDFQKRYQQFASKYNKIFTEVRHNRPKITEQDLKQWLDNAQKQDSYSVDYSEYSDAEHSFRDVEQLVLQINRGANASDLLAEDPVLEQYVDYVAQSSEYSGHPAGEKTVGWLRVDFVNSDWLLVDEVQSDLVNSVTQARAILEADDYDDFVANITNEKVKELVLERVSPQQFAAGKQNFIQSGYSLEKLDEIKARLIELFQDWAEYGIATLIEIARKHGISNVAIHTAETISQRDQVVESDKIKMYYDNLAKSFGFKKQQLNEGALQGNFWVRTASKNNELLADKDPDTYATVRSDPRQTSLYGTDHEDELRNLYAKPTAKFNSDLLKDKS